MRLLPFLESPSIRHDISLCYTYSLFRYRCHKSFDLFLSESIYIVGPNCHTFTSYNHLFIEHLVTFCNVARMGTIKLSTML